MKKVSLGLLLGILTLLSNPRRGDAQLALNLPDSITILKEVPYSDTLTADLYLPLNYQQGDPLPVVIFMNGIGVPNLKNWDQYVGWGRLIAASGMIGVTFESTDKQVEANFKTLLQFINDRAGQYRVDTGSIGLYACSANVGKGLPLANSSRQVSAAVIFYGFSKIERFRMDLPILFVRAGLDNNFLNRGLDSLIAKGIQANAPLSLVNFSGGHHGFEVEDLTTYSASIIREVIHFFQEQFNTKNAIAFRATLDESMAAGASYNNEWQQALTIYQRILKTEPKSPEILRRLGDAQVELGKYEDAIQSYDQSLGAGNWRKGEIARQKALAFTRLEKWKEAVDQLRILVPIKWYDEKRLSSDPAYSKLMKSEEFLKFKSELK